MKAFIGLSILLAAWKVSQWFGNPSGHTTGIIIFSVAAIYFGFVLYWMGRKLKNQRDGK